MPNGLVVAHSCNVRRCVNPKHLSIQTYSENQRYSHEQPGRKRRTGARPKKWNRPSPRPIPDLTEIDRQRFISKLMAPASNGCQLWPDFIAPDGYGRFAIKQINYPAHRVALFLKEGRQLLPNEVAIHSCRNRSCVAATHLRVGTQKENISDAVKIGLHNSVRQAGAKLTQGKADEIRERCAAGDSQLGLARDFGVSATAVRKILSGAMWTRGSSTTILAAPRTKASVVQWFQASGKTDWETPQKFFEQVDAHFKFKTDVCATSQNAKCFKFFSPQEDGLQQTWTGTCWCNPPYGRGIDRWLNKAWQSAQEGAVVVCLVPANTGTGWWHDHVVDRAAKVYFVRGKVRFVGATQGAPFGSALIVFGKKFKDPGLQFAA